MITKRYVGLEYIRGLLREGRSSFTRQDAALELDRQGAGLSNILSRLEKAGWIMSVSRGFSSAIFSAVNSGLQFSASASNILTENPWRRATAAIKPAQIGGSIPESVEASFP